MVLVTRFFHLSLVLPFPLLFSFNKTRVVVSASCFPNCSSGPNLLDCRTVPKPSWSQCFAFCFSKPEYICRLREHDRQASKVPGKGLFDTCCYWLILQCDIVCFSLKIMGCWGLRKRSETHHYDLIFNLVMRGSDTE